MKQNLSLLTTISIFDTHHSMLLVSKCEWSTNSIFWIMQDAERDSVLWQVVYFGGAFYFWKPICTSERCTTCLDHSCNWLSLDAYDTVESEEFKFIQTCLFFVVFTITALLRFSYICALYIHSNDKTALSSSFKNWMTNVTSIYYLSSVESF